MSMFGDIVWDAKGKDELCVNNLKTIKEYAERFPRGHWSSQGPGSEKKWYGFYDSKTTWILGPNCRELNFAGSSHPIFRATRALERGELRS